MFVSLNSNVCKIVWQGCCSILGFFSLSLLTEISALPPCQISDNCQDMYTYLPSTFNKATRIFTFTVHSRKNSRQLRSSISHLLFIPRCITNIGSRSFFVAAPNLWNTLPDNVKSANTVVIRHLKTYLFHRVYPT